MATGTQKTDKHTSGIQYWKCTTRTCPGRAHTTDSTDGLQLLKTADHYHESNFEETLGAKVKADLCQRAAENPTLPMREVYNTYFDSENAPIVDDLLEPQLRSCKSQMYTARRHNMPPLPETRDNINLEGQWGMTTVNQPSRTLV